MRVGCVLVHSFAVQVARTVSPQLDDRPLIIGGLPFEAKAVFDASPEATAFGVKVGMPLRQAYSLCPEARFLPLDEDKYGEVFEQVLSILESSSPVVEAEGLGCAYLDVSGTSSEEQLACKIRSSISSQTRLSACLGVSSNKFVSWAAAFSSRAEAPVIVPQGKEQEFIAPFSINLLPCSVKTRERLKLFGIRMIGELGQLPRDALTDQFGREGAILYELSHCIDSSPLVPRKKPEAISGVTELDPPAATYFRVLEMSEEMVNRLVSQAKAEGKACREIRLRVIFPSGVAEEKRLPLKEATSSEESLLIRVRAWLETASFHEPVGQVELSLSLEPERGRKVALWRERGAMKQELTRLTTELKVRFGYQPLKKVLMTDPQPLLPEDRFKLIELD